MSTLALTLLCFVICCNKQTDSLHGVPLWYFHLRIPSFVYTFEDLDHVFKVVQECEKFILTNKNVDRRWTNFDQENLLDPRAQVSSNS